MRLTEYDGTTAGCVKAQTCKTAVTNIMNEY